VRIPAVVVHGTEDPLVRFAGGEATARAIPGARLVRVDGMGHYTPESTWRMIVDEVAAVAAEADARAAPPRALDAARG
jgi:pimeloyl-ACP methyl ester carboxylesterase